MKNFTRRSFITTTAVTFGAKVATPFAKSGLAKSGSGRRILTLVYDKSLGMMRAVEKIVP